MLQLSTVGTSILAARLMGIANFGRFNVVMSVSTMFIGIAAGGLGVAATRYTARYSASDQQRLGSVLALANSIAIVTASVAACALLAFSGYISTHAYGLPDLAPTLRISSLYLFFIVLNGYQVGAAVGLGAFRAMTVVNGTQCVVSLLLVGMLAAIGGVPGATLGMGLAAGLMCFQYRLVLLRLLKERGVTLNYRNCMREMSVFWTFAMPSAVSGVVGALGTWQATVLLVSANDGVRQVALFNAALVLRQCVLFAPTIMQKVLSVSLSEMFGRIDPSIYRRVFYRSVAYNVAAGLAIAGPLLALKTPILRMFGREFVDRNNLAMYILIFAVFEVCATSLYQAIPAAGAMWLQFGILLFWAMALVISSGLLVSSLGAKGLALSYLVAWLVSVVAYYAASRVLLRSPEARIQEVISA